MRDMSALAEYRKAQGLTQDDLGKRLGVSRETVNRWECRRRVIAIEMLPKIARLTGIPAKSLRPDLAKLVGDGR